LFFSRFLTALSANVTSRPLSDGGASPVSKFFYLPPASSPVRPMRPVSSLSHSDRSFPDAYGISTRSGFRTELFD